MKSNSLVVILLFLSLSAIAQTDSTFSGTSSFLSIHSGGLFGKKGHGSSLSVSAIHGIQYKRLALGVGVGYDAYVEWLTLPVFASASYGLTTGKDAVFFVQTNTGYSRAWSRLPDVHQFNYSEEGGFFFHPMFGCRIDEAKFSVYFTAGYKFQDLSYKQTPDWWTWGHPGGKVTIDRKIQRLSIQIGIGLH